MDRTCSCSSIISSGSPRRAPSVGAARPHALGRGYQPTLGTEMGALQERITSTKKGLHHLGEAIYVPADDLTDPAPATAFAHLDATTVLSRQISSSASTPPWTRSIRRPASWIPIFIGNEHYDVAEVQLVLQRYKELQDIIAILGMDELSEEDKASPCPARVRSSASCRSPSRWPRPSPDPRKVRAPQGNHQGFKEVVEGRMDDIPEQAFYMVGRSRKCSRRRRSSATSVDLTGYARFG